MSVIGYELPQGATGFHLWQVLVTGEIRVRTVDWVTPLPPGLDADYSTPDGDVYVSEVLLPLSCDRCSSTEGHIGQGRWDDQLTLTCSRCGTGWVARWAGLSDEAETEASRQLLRQIVVQSGSAPYTVPGDRVREIRDDLQAGRWTPSRADQTLARELLLAVSGDPGPEAIARCMAATLPDRPLRSARFSEALARTVGLLRDPGAGIGAEPERSLVLDVVMDLARTVAAMDPAALRTEPEAAADTP
ncbi:hypothetical protein [Kitasatospora sp. NPDC001547]|uniref:hypothetical protein n=1 Tax=Kitasatospora sp. NPDC001547 TaxID=3364015 RepID=UPI003685556B